MGDFTIEIGKLSGNPGQYPVRLMEADVQVQAGAIPEADLDKSAITALQERYVKGAGLVDLVQDGRRLFTVLETALGNAWTDRAVPAAHIAFEIADENLQRAPWEILQKGNAWLSQQCSIVRRMPSAAPFTPADWPLRVLVVIATQDAAIGAEEEARNIVEALRPSLCLFHLRFSRLEDRPSLLYRIDQFRPHVLHFIGHGGRSPNGFPRLRFEGPAPWDWTSLDLSTDLNINGWTPTLVLLNACRSSLAAPDLEVGSVAGSCLEAGVPAVISMQGDIRGATAGQVSSAVYSALAQGSSIDDAIADARKAAYRLGLGAGSNPREAAMPALMVRVPPDKILRSVVPPTKDVLDRLRKCTEYKVTSYFVNQDERREKLIDALWPFQTKKQDRPLLLLRGGERTGKTALGCWLMDLCLRKNHLVRFVRINDGTPQNWLDFLRLLRGNEPSVTPILAPLPPDTFNLFHWQLQSWLVGREPGVWNNQPASDPGTTLDPSTASPNIVREPTRAEEPLGGAFQAFRNALVELAHVKPLTLVVDDFQGVDKANFWLLWDGLFQSVSNRELPGVQLVLCLTEREFVETYKIEENVQQSGRRLDNYAVCQVPSLKPDEFERLASDLIRYRYDLDDPAELAGALKRARANKFAQPWTMGQLQDFVREMCGTLGIGERQL